MIHKSYAETSPRIPSLCIRWVSKFSLPRVGIEGILYVNRENRCIYIWDEANDRYMEFFDKSHPAILTTNNNSNLVNSTINKPNSLYSFNLVNDTLVITDSEGVIIEIPIPNEESINDKIQSLEKRIENLEKLLD